MVIVLVVALILAAACGVLVSYALKSRAELRTIKSQLAATASELSAREEDRHALEKELQGLRLGAPSARLDASLNVLRDTAKATGGAPDKLASSPAPARDGN